MNLEILISTIVTSTAALIAIIGGFLVSRVITLSSEQNGINRKLREINNEITAKEDTLSQVTDYIISEDAFDFIRDNVEELSKGKISLEEIHKEDRFTGLSLEQLYPYVKEYESIFNEVKDLVSQFDSVPSDFYKFKKRLSTEVSQPGKLDWYELAYDYIYESLPSKNSGYPYLPDISSLSNLHKTVPPVNHYYRNQVKIKEQLETELAVLKLQKIEQDKILTEYGKPNGVWSGLAVLIYSGIVGIAYPVTLLPYPPNTYNDSLTKVVLIILFLSELVALFGYLILAMRKLTNDGK
ncbi:hypothetical protein [Oceanobacillus alkalisoli]|uniref:hypothetical protein n=1 Tax=Oceanobacillus alkalisoli TaxID=2925113 RepID=UPI001EE47982|nr:hypothetical protein [Oceanobacillus alkalisoli]MCG5105037.1 hypothetical protein [Oceanobacillus alkalisoli]